MGRSIPPSDIAPAEFFTRWVPEEFGGDAERRARLGDTEAVLAFELLGDGGGHFHLHVRAGAVLGAIGAPLAPDLQIRLDVTTWRELNSGDLTAPEAFLRRRLQLSGDLRLAIKLHVIIG
jgi:putative sterol carrier protein